MIYLYAFLIGGLICGIAQIIMNLFKLTVGHMTCLFVVIGTYFVHPINNKASTKTTFFMFYVIFLFYFYLF